MLTLIALMLPIVLIFMGFAVDLAYMQTTRMELRAAADAAARAGATALSQTDDSSAALRAAQLIGRRNQVAGEPLLLQNADIDVGRSVRQPSGKYEFTPGGTPPNAVRVNASRTARSRSGPVQLFFGRLIGRADFEPVQTATASFMNVDIALVLDRSSSMKYELNGGGGMSAIRYCQPPTPTSRWYALDSAVRVFIDELQSSDGEEQVALATYSSDAASFGNMCGTFPEPSSLDSPLSDDLNRIKSAMDDLKTTVWNGRTYIEAGMLTGLAGLLDPSRTRSTATKLMIVLTDGNENIGSAMAAAAVAKSSQITVHTITFSDDANQSLMRNVAKATGGTHYHADTAEQLREVFRELAAQVAVLTH